MAHQVVWNKQVLETFIELAMLSEMEIKVMETRVKGWTITKQAMEFGLSESSIKRIVSMLKKKYDNVQPLAPNILPIRRTSKEEDYMDTH